MDYTDSEQGQYDLMRAESESQQEAMDVSVNTIVDRLPSRIVQVNSVSIPSGPNNGDYVELIALCADGSLWLQYRSNGYANVPNDGRWFLLHPEHESGKPVDRLTAVVPDLLEAIQAALRIESLWMPPDSENNPEYDAEFAALAMMRNKFKEVVAKADDATQ